MSVATRVVVRVIVVVVVVVIVVVVVVDVRGGGVVVTLSLYSNASLRHRVCNQFPIISTARVFEGFQHESTTTRVL